MTQYPSRTLAFLLTIVIALLGLGQISSAHNPHGDCTHAVYSPYDIIQGRDGGFDMCNGLESAGSVMYAYAGDDTFQGMGGPDEMHGGWGNDDLYADTGHDLIRDGGGDDNDHDEICDGDGDDPANVQDELFCCYPEDWVYRVNDGVSGESTTKDSWDQIYYWTRTDCPDITTND